MESVQVLFGAAQSEIAYRLGENGMSDEKPDLIYEQMVKVMAGIGAIEKGQRNDFHKYSFRGIDDIYNAAHAVLVEHKVMCLPTVIDTTREQKKGTDSKVIFYTVLTVRYDFYAVDGSTVSSTVVGEAMDTSDKSANKAMSAAMKLVFLQGFCIPTEEQKDTEHESHEVEHEEKKEQKKKPPKKKEENGDDLGKARRGTRAKQGDALIADDHFKAHYTTKYKVKSYNDLSLEQLRQLWLDVHPYHGILEMGAAKQISKVDLALYMVAEGTDDGNPMSVQADYLEHVTESIESNLGELKKAVHEAAQQGDLGVEG